jgi:drug/metabolite transporter (DMT)-like permease
MLAASVVFVAMTSLVKYLGDDYAPQVQNLYRQGAALIGVLPFILRDPSGVLPVRRMGLIVMRTFCGTIGVILTFYSYQEMPLAEANALSFTRALWVTLLAALVLKETLGIHRIAALLIGFGGVILLLRPGAHFHLGLPQAAALAATLLLALSITGMKSMTRDFRPISVLAWSALLGTLISIPASIPVWRWPSPADFALLALMGGLGVFNQFFFIRGMAACDAAAMAPLDYSRLVLSVGAGYLLFSEVPDALALAGAGVIVVSTLYITIRELHLARQARRAAAITPDAAV